MKTLPIAKINRANFIEWLFNYSEDLDQLAYRVVSGLKQDGEFSINADDEFDNVSYIRIDMIENYEDIQAELEESGYMTSGGDDEIHMPSTVMKVEWT
jgi:hypothetical protein